MDSTHPIARKLNIPDSHLRILGIILAVALLAGVGTGYVLASGNKSTGGGAMISTSQAPAQAQQDAKTFRDFAVGVIKKKPEPKKGEYAEGTHTLIREGADPATLTSSVVDLSQYEGKKVKVFGETQQSKESGWLMDVGRVEVQ